MRDVLQRRIARLPATAQTILRQAAVIGTETDADVLADVTGAQEHVLLDAIEAGLLTGLVTEPAAGRIRFAHALVRDTLYHSLSRLRRSRLHARAAEAIERRSPGEVAALAYHFAEVGTDPAKAARYCAWPPSRPSSGSPTTRPPGSTSRPSPALTRPAPPRPGTGWSWCSAWSARWPAPAIWPAPAPYHYDAVRAALPLDDPVLLARVITAFDVPSPFSPTNTAQPTMSWSPRSSRRWPGCRPATIRCAAACSSRWPSNWRAPSPSAATRPQPRPSRWPGASATPTC